MCVCAQSLGHVCLLLTPRTVACQTPPSMGFSRQEYWRGLPCPPPGDLPNSGIEPMSLASPALAEGFFTTVPPRKPEKIIKQHMTRSKERVDLVWVEGNEEIVSQDFKLSVQSLSCVQLFVTPWTAARQASLSITNCRSSNLESEITRELFQHKWLDRISRVSHSGDLERIPKTFCISNKLAENIDASGLGTTLWEPLLDEVSISSSEQHGLPWSF